MEVKNYNTKFKKKKRWKKKKNELVLVFDEDARKEFLTGFHKRKQQRINKRKEELEQQLKLEKKRIKYETREQYQKIFPTYKENSNMDDLFSEKIDLGTHLITIKELSSAELARKNNWVGINEVVYDEKKFEGETRGLEKSQENSELEGMELNSNIKKKSLNTNSVKDIKKAIKHQAAIKVKESRIFQKKAIMERIRNIKRHKRKRRMQEKLKKKDKRSKHKG